MNKEFTRTGAVAHPDFFYFAKQGQEHARIENQMRKEGFIPVLDSPPVTEVYSIEGKDTYGYSVTMTGKKVGVKAWKYQGVLEDKLIPLSMTQKK
jgi:hypothetical protein